MIGHQMSKLYRPFKTKFLLSSNLLVVLININERLGEVSVWKRDKEAKYLDHFSNSSYEASFQETTRMPHIIS